jgi:peptidoglycan/LPS O-acetylase OafA/YrhL
VKSLAYALFGTLVVLPVIAGDSDREAPLAVRVLGTGPARFLGNISYGVFCYHLVALGLVESFLDYEIFTGGFTKLFVPTLALTIAAASASYYGLERPLMRLGRRTERRPGSTTSGATQATPVAASTRT